MAKPEKKKSLLEKKKELERVADEVEQHFQKVSVWQTRKEEREKKEKEWPSWCQRFDELIVRLVEIIQSSPEFCEEIRDDKRYNLLRDYYQGLCLRMNRDPGTQGQSPSGWVQVGAGEQPLEYNEVGHLIGFIRAVVHRISPLAPSLRQGRYAFFLVLQILRAPIPRERQRSGQLARGLGL